MNKWGIQLSDLVENIVEKEKLLFTSNFSYSHNVFKSCQLLMRQNEYLWSKGLRKDPIVNFPADRSFMLYNNSQWFIYRE